jgi:molecular chaperone DnaK
LGKIIGIDLGTTNSCVAVFQGGKSLVIPNREGSTTTPSIVGYTAGMGRLVGVVAKHQMMNNPANTFYSVKRLIGRKYDSPEVQHSLTILPYGVHAAENGDVRLEVDGKPLTIPEVQAEVLATMKNVAATYLGEEINEAVITVPAYFNDAQRQATKDAGVIAGLNVLRIINEPTAASLAYGLDRTGQRTIAVYDLGGGTFDISILEIGDGVFQVRSTSGDTFLGGDDFDLKIIQHLQREFQRREGLPLPSDPVILQRLKDAAQEAKHILSAEEETGINLPFIAVLAGTPRHLKLTLTRADLEGMVEDLIQRTLAPCRQALSDAGLKVEEIGEVVMVGGQTRMPRVRAVVKDFFRRELHVGLNPDEVVAVGAALQGAILKGDYDDVVLLDVTPLSLGLETKGGIFTSFIERNTTIPTRKTMTFTTTEDNQSSVTVHVLQGERKMAADNISLGQFDLVGIPPAPRGIPKIEVTFDLDANGILSVSARNQATGQSQAIRITPSGGLTKEEIGALIREAAASRQEDERRRTLVLLQNEADATIYAAENLIRHYTQQLNQVQREHCLDLIRSLKTSLAKGDRLAIEKNLNELRLLTNHIVHTLI